MMTFPTAPDWTEQAICAQVGDDELWFPGAGKSPRRAKAICATCPVIDSCREAIMAAPRDTLGVWAGTTWHERLMMRNKARDAA